MNKMMTTFFLPSLTAVMDLAYVEDASGTHEMLKLLNMILRYDTDEHRITTLGKEVEAVEALLEVCRYRFGNFSYDIHWNTDEAYKEIEKYVLLMQVVNRMELRQRSCSGFDDIVLDVKELLGGGEDYENCDDC